MTAIATQYLWTIRTIFVGLCLVLASYHPTIQRRVIQRCVSSFEADVHAKLESSRAVFHVIPGQVVFYDLVVKKADDASPVIYANKSCIDFAPAQSLLCMKFVFETAIFGLRLPLHRGVDAVLDVIDLFKDLVSVKSQSVMLRRLQLHGLSIGTTSSAVSIQADEQTALQQNVCVDSGSLLFPVDINAIYPSRFGTICITVPGVEGPRKIYGEIIGRGEKSFVVLREGAVLRMVLEHTKQRVKYCGVAPLDDVSATTAALFPEKPIAEKYASLRPRIHAYDVLVKFRGTYEPDLKKGSLQCIVSHTQDDKKQQVLGVVHHTQTAFCVQGDLKNADESIITFSSSGDVREKKWNFELKNLTPLNLPFGLRVEPGNLSASGKRGILGNVFGQYVANATLPAERGGGALKARGIYSYHDDLFSLVGKINDRVSYCAAQCDDGFRIKRAVILDHKNNPELFLSGQGVANEKLVGKINGRACMRLLPTAIKNKLIGDFGHLQVVCDQSQMPLRCQGALQLKDSSFCVGGSSNALLSGGMRFEVDFLLNAATLSDLEIHSSCGEINSKEVLLNWGDGGILFAHVPVGVRNFLINRGKDFYAIVDGDCAFDLIHGGRHSIDGAFVIKKSGLSKLQLDDSGPLDGSFYSMLLKKTEFLGIDGALTIKTQEPLSVTLPMLRTSVHVNAKVDIGIQGVGSIIPKISGTLKLDGGELDVLGRSLRIMRGLVHILPAQNDNPVIDFLAYTNIKQYRIAIHGTGTIQRPSFVFESTPPLSQEQIIGLMLSGAEHPDINQQLPGIFLQNIHKILQSPEVSGKKNMLQALFNSFKYIQLLPYQDDLSSQKTVKARLNVDLGPHLRALFHKDILGKEAIALQFEYDVSNDLFLRFLRQTSGFVGAEAEMRFKF
jgi:hypothetical protein